MCFDESLSPNVVSDHADCIQKYNEKERNKVLGIQS
jgi:hypothetical protein